MYFRHKKTGGIYQLVALGAREADLAPMVSYACAETGMVWFRPADEFFDGRYEVYVPTAETPGSGRVH